MMGADADVFIFDYETYTREVAPTFRQILLTDQVPEWLYPVVEKRNIELRYGRPTDISRHCTYFDKAFSWVGPYDGADTYEFDWKQRACKSIECAERGHCPFHVNQPPERIAELLWLYEAAVSMKCLGSSQFVGRSMVVTRYWQSLSDMGVTRKDPLVDLLVHLGKRGFVIGYQWGFGYEGINGWLDPQETGELAHRLGELPLPEYDPSFDAMKRFNKPNPVAELYERFGSTDYVCPGFSLEALSLSFVRTVATIAATQNKGILWGNDVMGADFYLKRFYDDATT